MKLKLSTLIAAILIPASALVSNAQKTIQIYEFGSPSASYEVALSDVAKIEFKDHSFDVVSNTDNSITSFALPAVQKIVFNKSTGIEEIAGDASAIVVAPNPVRDNLIVRGANDLYGSDLSIYSALGQLVFKQSAWNGETIDVSQLPSGIYFINIQSTTIKFIKL